MNSRLIEDIVEWDIKNWSKALDYWSKNAKVDSGELDCLELGGRRGGPSLWLAMQGNNVICSDLESPEEQAKPLHEKYKCEDLVVYESINATDIPYENRFDIVIFKSILGGISGNGQNELKKKTIDEIYKSLKPGGKLLFAENLESSGLHRFMRKKFVNWGSRWNYLKYSEINHVFDSFEVKNFETAGFFGAFGRTEKQRKFLSFFDEIFKFIIPKSKRYIVFGIAEKAR